jgi:S1-C subfamily serine protease
MLGLQSGDVIVRVNSQPVGSAEDSKRAIDTLGARGPIALVIERGQRLLQTPPFTLR